MTGNTRIGSTWLPITIAVALGVLGATHARAQNLGDISRKDEEKSMGTLFVPGEDGVSRPAVALATDVEIRAAGLVARVRVSQRFRNESDRWVEGVYVFPLPEMAAVDRMSLQVGERRIEGRIQERAEAKRSYEKAKADGKTASLLEQERPNLFTMSVANIGPGEPIEISIEYQQTIQYESGGFELRFPMTLTTRYVPGGTEQDTPPLTPEQLTAPDGTGWSQASTAVPDAARITPPLLHPALPVTHRLSLHVALDAGFPLETLTSPSHTLETEDRGGHHYEVWLDDVPADRDFLLRWTAEPGHEPRAAIFSEEHNGEHYLLLMLLPPDPGTASRRIPREAILVIDTSGSMAGTSIRQARAALHLALDRLVPEDSFNVIAFDDSPNALFGTSQPADARTVERAHRFVDGLRADGGTEMRATLELALRGSEPNDPQLRQVIFITDGAIANEAELFAIIQRDLAASRLFMVGIGSAPNAYFLKRAASFGRGTATLIGNQDEVQERMAALFRKIENPVLRDLEVYWNDEVEMWPARLPDLYAGEPVLVTAKLQRFVGEVVLQGRRGRQPFEVRLPLTPGAPESGIHKLWARRKIAHWMAQGTAGAPADQVREEVLAVALEHELVSKFTSLVAVEVTPRRPHGEDLHGSNVPNHGPVGFDPATLPGVLLPRTATPAPLLFGLGSLALLLAMSLWRAERHPT